MIVCGDRVRDHFENPRRVGRFDDDITNVGGAIIGSLAAGRILQLQIRISDNRVEDACFKAYGCAFTIACGSWLSEWAIGKSSEQLLQLHNRDISEALFLPALKIQCAVTAEQALKAALDDYRLHRTDKAVVGDR